MTGRLYDFIADDNCAALQEFFERRQPNLSPDTVEDLLCHAARHNAVHSAQFLASRFDLSPAALRSALQTDPEANWIHPDFAANLLDVSLRKQQWDAVVLILRHWRSMMMGPESLVVVKQLLAQGRADLLHAVVHIEGRQEMMQGWIEHLFSEGGSRSEEVALAIIPHLTETALAHICQSTKDSNRLYQLLGQGTYSPEWLADQLHFAIRHQKVRYAAALWQYHSYQHHGMPWDMILDLYRALAQLATDPNLLPTARKAYHRIACMLPHHRREDYQLTDARKIELAWILAEGLPEAAQYLVIESGPFLGKETERENWVRWLEFSIASRRPALTHHLLNVRPTGILHDVARLIDNLCESKSWEHLHHLLIVMADSSCLDSDAVQKWRRCLRDLFVSAYHDYALYRTGVLAQLLRVLLHPPFEFARELPSQIIHAMAVSQKPEHCQVALEAIRLRGHVDDIDVKVWDD
jgi:hypothetical protein